MSYTNLGGYEVVRSSELVYDITAVLENSQPIPNSVQRTSFMLQDEQGSFLAARGKVVGNQVVLDTLVDSSAAVAEPAWSGMITARSVELAQDIELRQGMNGIVIAGDSRAVGYSGGGNEGIDGPYDYVDPSILMRGHASLNDKAPLYAVLKEPVRHIIPNGDYPATNLSVAIPLSHGLKARGVNNLCILANGQSSVGFSAYGASFGNIGSGATDAGNAGIMHDHMEDFLADSDANSMYAIVYYVGTNDTQYGYQAFLDRMIWMVNRDRARYESQTGRDGKRLPIIFMGQVEKLLNDPAGATESTGYFFNYSTAPEREQALQDLVNIMPHTAYVSMTGLNTNGDFFHDDDEASRECGYNRIPDAIERAQKNHAPINALAANTAYVDAPTSVGTITLSNNLSANTTIEAPVSSGSITVNGGVNEINGAPEVPAPSSSGSATVTEPSATPTLDANAFDIVLRPDQGITSDASGNVSNWQSVGSNAMNFPQTVAARQPKLAAGGGIDCRGNKRLHKASGFDLLRNVTAGSTIIVSFTPSSTSGHLLGTTDSRIGMGTASWANSMTWQGAGFGHSGAWLVPDVRQELVLTIDSTDGYRIDHDDVNLHTNANSNPANANVSHFTIGGWETINYFDGIIHAVAIKDGSGHMAKATTDAIAAELNAL